MIKKKVIVWLVVIFVVGIFLQFLRIAGMVWAFRLHQAEPTFEFEYMSTEIPSEYARVVVLYSPEDDELCNNISYTFIMAKLNYLFLPVGTDALDNILKNLNEEDLLVIGTEGLGELKNYNSVINYVRNGGRAVFLIRSYFEPFDEMLGITENKGYLDKEVKMLKFEKEIFSGMDDLEFEHSGGSMLNIKLADDVKIVATSSGRPLIWTKKYGAGEILYVNSTMMRSKTNRGLLLKCVAYLPDYFLTTIFNAIIFNIDDFPGPIMIGEHEEIYGDYFMDTVSFFKRIWWSDIYNFARRHNIALTGLAIASFNDDTVSPLEPLNKGVLDQINYFGRKLVQAEGEIGIHGYNHQSLALEGQMEFEKYGYFPWESQETMEEGLKIFRTALEDMFGEIIFFTYVAPSNIISKDGRIAVKNVFDDVRMFAGIYTGRDEKGLLVQEFGRDPYVPDVVSFPRISSGHLYSTRMMWRIYSVIAHYGLVNHFIHPDDIFCEERSGGLSWDELDRELNKIFGEIRENFPFLRPMTNREAYKNFLKLENLSVYSRKEGNTIHIYYENAVAPVYHFLRLRNRNIMRVEGGDFTLVDRGSNLYLVEGQSAEVKIILK